MVATGVEPRGIFARFYRDNDERAEEKLSFAGDELVPEETRGP